MFLLYHSIKVSLMKKEKAPIWVRCFDIVTLL